MSEAPLVTCFMPTRDRRRFVPLAIQQFLCQDYPDRELLVLDDGTDTVADLVPDHPAIRYERIRPTSTLGAKRNLGCRMARGELIANWDDDDWSAPWRLSRQVEALIRTGADVCGLSEMCFFDLSSEAVWRYRYPPSRTRPWVAGGTMCFRKDFWAEHPFPEIQVGSDTVFLWQGRPRVHALDAPGMYVATTHPGNTSPRRVSGAWWRPAERSDLPAEFLGAVRPGTCVVITTCERPEQLGRLLDDIEREWPGGGLDVRVYDDGSAADYAHQRRRLAAQGWRYAKAEQRHGKHDWWRFWNWILADLRDTTADRFYVLQDDMRLCEGFPTLSARLWNEIPDDGKVSLFLHLDEHVAAGGRSGWTRVRDRPVGEVVCCGWLDLTAFLCERHLFDALDWRLSPIPVQRWTRDPLLGSGVGAQISVRLHRLGLRMYRTSESLTVHDHSPSLMNPQARRHKPMRTVRFAGGEHEAARLAGAEPDVLVAVASVPQRESGLAEVVERLLPQATRIGVYLNDYPAVPPFLDHPRISVATSQEHGDRGDAGKFFWAEQASGYVVLCDDDIRYPPDYVGRILAAIDLYGRRSVVGFHGATMKEPVTDYHRSRRVHHFSGELETDTPVHLLGTGAAGYHASTLRIRSADFPAPNMADLFFAIAGQHQRVPFTCLAHGRGWLTGIPGLSGDSIYARSVGDAAFRAEMTRTARQAGTWILHRVPDPLVGLVQVPVRGPAARTRLMLPEHDHITLAIQRSGTYYEHDLLDAIRSRRRTGTYVDVGAHYGNHTLYFALECPADRVVAIEPNPVSHAGMLANVRAADVEDRVTALPIAIHPDAERVSLVPLPWRPRPGGARTNSGMYGVTVGGPTPAVRLDRALADVGDIAVVKVDAEGLGAEILRSGLGLLTRDRPLVAVEAASDEQQESIRVLLAPLGYRLAGRYCWTPTWLWEPTQ
ncbi:FkbM family methyltransferase [Nonomuraea sp. NPDC052116]|uniref:FkbM family methyltransferase n=1 Tax=Nonomuraea sp. NPDC052116 TaxID=3155665 RepID=UPI0034197A5F